MEENNSDSKQSFPKAHSDVWTTVLVALAKRDEQLELDDISVVTGISQSKVREVVEAMEKNEWVQWNEEHQEAIEPGQKMDENII
ncbi:hypothetical protein HSRCO_1143 [Halanaeroarchaeum sp. HSR-CO]|uniref:helix-turn-helix domain-containing protein n=1 Tax=Halanaeroarchaeum sp. HSR-CO TaxID=2866382 RepID=UPI00217DAD12|nr:helix-turn-helix domain-containing protein [Halanaeroarchaeum sp. HSR-CO]UWG47430.1 hypothetical protein HSRCO_1143 [Halanaeroarchaeum sp. HSR-CO]